MEPSIFHNDEAGRAAFRDFATRAIEWIVKYYASIESFPVRSNVKPGEIISHFQAQPPPSPGTTQEIFRTLDEVIMPGMTHWQHPSFFAFFPGNTSFPSIVAELITSGLAAQCMMWESSPAATELEEVCMKWLIDLLGLPPSWSGVIQDTASTATLTALLTAREWKSGYRISKRGFDGTVYRIYASSQAHSSVEKAVRLAGFGTDHFVKIDTYTSLAMIPARLESRIQDDIAHGFVPLCVISTIGTTATGAVDPLYEISEISNRYGLWHHIDAAYAGTALMLEEYAQLRRGIEGADSFVCNPHKWMFVQFDCTAYFVKDPELLIRTMSIQPSYLMTVHGDQVKDYRDWGIPLGRRFRALKLWMTLQMLGTDAIRQRLRHHIQLAMKAESCILSDPKLEQAYPRSFNILTFRIKEEYDPNGKATMALGRMINDSGKAYMTYTVIESRGFIRWVTGQTYVEEKHIDETWELILSLLDIINSR